MPGLARFRVNAYYQRASWARRSASSDRDPDLEELSLPPVAAASWGRKPRGLVLVTGPTGSGKSTTLAAMINEINEKRSATS